ncbi:facilitated trehalose transporter Tret1-like [Chrysoperla carnea]|uniref:facilitated trehalose transporter Tret1-like n=1 Tax=Chrysoperla carnea TaxID=189513 RepID=UPI001D05E51C|nr:facilitated trehalose transporter Tret1-like [Chrysoperla carnea]
MQLRNALIISLSNILYGLQFLWASAVNSNKDDENHQRFTSNEIVWLLSIYPIGEAISPILILIFGNAAGRKQILLYTMALLSVTNIFLYSSNLYVILFTRILSAILLGFNCTMAPVLIGETSSSSVRGKYLTLLAINANFGLVAGFILIGKFSLQIYNLLLIITPIVLFILTFLFVIESPYYDVIIDKKDKALKSLEKLKLSKNIEQDLFVIEEFIQEQQKSVGFMKLFKKKQNQLSCLFVTGYQIANTFTGIDFILIYMYFIVELVTEDSQYEFQTSLLFSSSGLIMCVITSFLIDKWGRRPLFIMSSILTSLFLFILGAYFYLLNYNESIKRFGYVVIICLVLYKISISIGLSSLPKVCAGELFEPKFVHIGSSISRTLYNLSSFLIVWTNSYLIQIIGMSGIFIEFGVICLIFGVAFTLIVPETKNKSLERIQLELKQYKINSKNI